MDWNDAVFVGIDPGTAGAIAVLDIEGNFVSVDDLPYLGGQVDVVAVWEMLKTVPSLAVVIERQQALPVTGRASAFKIGQNYGRLTGLMDILSQNGSVNRIHLPPPATWTKEMKLTRDKTAVLLAARRRWPSAPLARIKDEGRAHALFLAEWGRRQR